MISQLLKYLLIYLISMFKFVGGPAFGAAYELNMWGIVIMTVLGMMTTVVVISTFGVRLRQWFEKKNKYRKKLFTSRNRRIVRIWRGYGEFGVSFFTPVLFSPIVGTLLIMALGGRPKKVYLFMFISALFWAITLTTLSDLVLELLFKL